MIGWGARCPTWLAASYLCEQMKTRSKLFIDWNSTVYDSWWRRQCMDSFRAMVRYMQPFNVDDRQVLPIIPKHSRKTRRAKLGKYYQYRCNLGNLSVSNIERTPSCRFAETYDIEKALMMYVAINAFAVIQKFRREENVRRSGIWWKIRLPF